MRFILCLLLSALIFFLPGQSAAQTYEWKNDIPVIVNGDSLVSAWAGGMNAPQFSDIDLNLDGIKDIVVFDREDEYFIPYLNEGIPGEASYTFAPEYTKIFADCNCDGWALLEDYNCDGLEDVFCGNNSNVDIFEQVIRNGKVEFEKVLTQVESHYGSSHLWLYSAKIDIPAIIDIDDDGDVDFLTWKLGFNTLEFHRNRAVEDYGRCDTLVFWEETGCWGHFIENATDNSMVLGDTTYCPLGNFDPSGCMDTGRPALGGRGDLTEGGGVHTGSTTLLLDLNGDNVNDVLIGDISFSNVVGMLNCGTIDYAFMDSADLVYPNYDLPVDLELFPGCYHLDTDNDGIRDLVVAVNTSVASENKNSVIRYHNRGADDIPDFNYQGTGFLQEDNFDFGAGAAPAFLDYNQDGLQDLLVGNKGYFDRSTGGFTYGLSLYENTGTADLPTYTLVDDDYLSILSGNFPGLGSIAPEAGDLDGDGDEDLLLGTTGGTLFYFENQAAPGAPADFVYQTDQYALVDVNAQSAPALYDIDNDNDLDLFVGNQRGKIAFYSNEGSATQPDFKAATDSWGAIQIRDAFGGTFAGNAKPMLIDYDGDSNVEMLIGSITGFVEIFEITGDPLTDTLMSSGQLFDHSVGSYASPAAGLLDSTGNVTYVIGNQRGGLHLFHTLEDGVYNPPTSIDEPDFAEQIGLEVFPNPTRGTLFIRWDDASLRQQVDIAVYDGLGRKVRQANKVTSGVSLDLQGMSPGIYSVAIGTGSQLAVKKVVLTR